MNARRLVVPILALALLAAAASIAAPAAELAEAHACDRQWTGVAVAPDGRVFVNFPRWSPDVPVSVGVLDGAGAVRAYPDSAWNAWAPGQDPAERFVCVQSVHVDDAGSLWALDPASPFLQGVVPGGAKLVRIDPATGTVERIYYFRDSAPPASYLNDVRVDTRTRTAFITDSGLGALVVLDLETGRSRRLLEGHPSTRAEGESITVGGRPLPIVVHADGIALDRAGGRLYWQALTGRTLYRAPTAALADTALEAEALAAQVEPVAESGVSDGLLWTPGGVLVSALEEDAIKRVRPDGTVETLVADERLQWPDSFAAGPDGAVWVTTSQIHLGPNPPAPYLILKLTIED